MNNETHTDPIARLTWADKRRELAWAMYGKRQRELSLSESATIDNILGR